MDNNKDISALTGLRFFAALSIIIGHYLAFTEININGLIIKPGDITALGMPLFFVLSGFVIHFRYGYEFAESNHKFATSLAAFFSARFARLFPLLIFIIFVYLTVGMQYKLAVTNHDYIKFILLYAIAMQSWFPIWFDGHAAMDSFVALSWSISTEAFFYICYPLFAILLFRMKSVQSLRLLFVIISALSFIWLWYVLSNISLWEEKASDIFSQLIFSKDDYNNSFARWFTYISPYSRIFEFILGAITAQLYMTLSNMSPDCKGGKLGLFMTLSSLMLILIVLCFTLTKYDNNVMSVMPTNIIFAIPISVLIFSVARYRNFLSEFLSARIILFLGEISYSLYLTHVLFNQLKKINPVFNITNEYNIYTIISVLLFKIALTIAFSTITYKLIEVPGRKFIRDVTYKLLSKPMGSYIILLCFILVGFTGMYLIYYLNFIAGSLSAI